MNDNVKSYPNLTPAVPEVFLYVSEEVFGHRNTEDVMIDQLLPNMVLFKLAQDHHQHSRKADPYSHGIKCRR